LFLGWRKLVVRASNVFLLSLQHELQARASWGENINSLINMKRYDFQNTKNVLIFNFLMAFVFLCSCTNLPLYKKNCRPISTFVELSIVPSIDTISISRDSLIITLLFRNKIDTALLFYPKAYIYLNKSSGSFESQSYVLNNFLDATNKTKIDRLSKYKESFKIDLRNAFFNKGLNTFRLVYLCHEFKGEDQIFNTLCGSLESNEVSLYLK